MEGIRARCDNCQVRRYGICAALDIDARAELLEFSRRRLIPAQHAIFRDGDATAYYYNITSGIVKLVKTLADGQQHIVGLLYPADFMGQSLNKHHTYAAESATDVELCVYPRASFELFLKSHPELERRIFYSTIRELDLCRDWTQARWADANCLLEDVIEHRPIQRKSILRLVAFSACGVRLT